jgi:hypothetical protein
VLAGILALALAAGATLIATGGLSFGASDARPTAAPAHDGPTVERIQLVEDNVFSLSGAYIGSTSAEQIQFLEDNLFSLGKHASGANIEVMEFFEQNAYLGGAGTAQLPHTNSPRQVDY